MNARHIAVFRHERFNPRDLDLASQVVERGEESTGGELGSLLTRLLEPDPSGLLACWSVQAGQPIRGRVRHGLPGTLARAC